MNLYVYNQYINSGGLSAYTNKIIYDLRFYNLRLKSFPLINYSTITQNFIINQPRFAEFYSHSTQSILFSRNDWFQRRKIEDAHIVNNG